MAVLSPSVGSDRFSLFAAAAITGSAQVSGAVPMSGVSTAVFEITTNGGNATDADFFIEGTNDATVAAGSSGWLPAETVSDVANGSGAGGSFTADAYAFHHTLPASTTALSWPTPCGFGWLRLTFTGGAAAGTVTVNLQRARGNG